VQHVRMPADGSAYVAPAGLRPEPEPEPPVKKKKQQQETKEPPPKPPSAQAIAIEGARAEGAVAFERHGQPLVLALARGRNELHVVAGAATWASRKLAAAKGAVGVGEDDQQTWAATHSWAPCCDCSRRATGESPRRRPRGSPRGDSRQAGPPAEITSRVLAAGDHRIAAFAVDPRADAVYSGSDTGELIGWDLSAGSKTWVVPPFSPSPGVRPSAVTAMSVCRGVLSVTSLDGTVRGLEPTSGEQLWTLAGESIGAISVGGGVIYTGSYDKTVRATAADTGKEVWCFSGHADAVRAIARDSKKLYTGSWDNTVRALALKDGTEKWCFSGHQRPITALSLGSDGVLYTASYDRTVRALRVASGTEMWVFAGHKGAVRSLAVCDTRVYSGGEDMRVFGINAETGQKVWRYKGHTRRVRAVTVCKDVEDVGNSAVFTTSDDDTVRVLKAEDGEEKWVSRWGWMATPASRAVVDQKAQAAASELEQDGEELAKSEESQP
jgi:outer membrane protein assembly factor BamB